jgi:putative transposase
MTHVQSSRRSRISLFITVALSEPARVNLVQHVDALRAAVRRVKDARPFHIRAMVILPDHLHAIWTLPAQDHDLAARWADISSGLVAGYATARGSAGMAGGSAPWTLRHYQIADDVEKRQMTQRCWMDPVKHGLVSDPFDWPHSSIHRDAIREEVSPRLYDTVPMVDAEQPQPSRLISAGP